ncbi:MAG: hypothetical protein AAFV45_03365 [Pseudomonadota bacterium]
MTPILKTVAAISVCAASFGLAAQANAAPGAGFGLKKSLAHQMQDTSPLIKVQARGNGEGRRNRSGNRNSSGNARNANAGKKSGGKLPVHGRASRAVVESKFPKQKKANKQRRIVKQVLRGAGLLPKKRGYNRANGRRFACAAVARTRRGSGRPIGIRGFARGRNACARAMRECRQELRFRKSRGRNPRAACVIR